jgi:hypothetical protein
MPVVDALMYVTPVPLHFVCIDCAAEAKASRSTSSFWNDISDCMSLAISLISANKHTDCTYTFVTLQVVVGAVAWPVGLARSACEYCQGQLPLSVCYSQLARVPLLGLGTTPCHEQQVQFLSMMRWQDTDYASRLLEQFAKFDGGARSLSRPAFSTSSCECHCTYKVITNPVNCHQTTSNAILLIQCCGLFFAEQSGTAKAHMSVKQAYAVLLKWTL